MMWPKQYKYTIACTPNIKDSAMYSRKLRNLTCVSHYNIAYFNLETYIMVNYVLLSHTM